MINRSRPPLAFAAIALVAVGSVLAVPSAASAGTPVAQAMYAYSSGPTTAVVVGSVNPEGEDTQYQIPYGPASSDWCTSVGASGSPSGTSFGHVGSDSSTYTFFVHMPADLTNGIKYCAHFIATNNSGTVDGGQVTWTQGLPSAATVSGVSTADSTATVQGFVNPAGQSTSYVVKYDLASSVWCSSAGASGTPADATAPQILPNTDGTFDGIPPVDLIGLTPGASYCAEIVATNSTGTTPIDDGKQVTWGQPTPPPTPVPAACIVPKVTGKSLSAAKRAIKSHHCSVGKVTKVESTNRNRGRVVSQTPKPGKHLRKGANVALKVGK